MFVLSRNQFVVYGNGNADQDYKVSETIDDNIKVDTIIPLIIS